VLVLESLDEPLHVFYGVFHISGGVQPVEVLAGASARLQVSSVFAGCFADG
jgi:hypothetical protein